MKQQTIINVNLKEKTGKTENSEKMTVAFPATDKLLIILEEDTPLTVIRLESNSVEVYFSKKAKIDRPYLPQKNSDKLWVLTLKIKSKEIVSIKVPKDVLLEIRTY